MKMKTRIASALAAAAMLGAGLTVAAAGTASAGVRGQQIFMDNHATTWTAVQIQGENQYGNSNNIVTETILVPPGQSPVYTTGWWWEGDVHIKWSTGETRNCEVPVSNGSTTNNWSFCGAFNPP
jgi:hypothetical protein